MKIPQGTIGDRSLAPAWIAISDGKGGMVKPCIRCRCGQLIGLRLHHVHADGRVTSSFLHPEVPGTAGSSDTRPGCGFHEFLELEGYDGPECPPGT